MITCCTSRHSYFDHWNHSHQSLSACAAAASAHTVHPELCPSQILSRTCHTWADPATVEVARRTGLLLAVICHSGKQSFAHPCCFEHRFYQRHAYLSHNQSCLQECYIDWAAGSVCYTRPSSHSRDRTCQRHLAAAIIHTKWDPTGHTKIPSKHLIDSNSQQDPRLITAPFRVTVTSPHSRESWLSSRPGKGDGSWKGFAFICVILLLYLHQCIKFQILGLIYWYVEWKLSRFVPFTFAV